MISQTTVVLGGGGIWGVAWITGIVTALAEHGIQLTQARAFIGTSAGSIVGNQLAYGSPPAELFARQTQPPMQPIDAPKLTSGFAQLMAMMQHPWDSLEARTRAIVDLALNSEAGPPLSDAEATERFGIPSSDWPARPLSITAVDTATCELVVFTAQSGVPLVQAVAASCAVPGVSPPVRINGRLYMDGGLWRNPENAHVAKGAPSVLILSPFGARMPATPHSLHSDIQDLQQAGSRVVLIAGDDQALSTMGPAGPLDPSIRAATAEAGRAQGHREADKIQSWLG